MSAEIVITEIDRLEEYAARECDLRNCVIQGLDLREQASCLGNAIVTGAVFLGCQFGSDEEEIGRAHV